MVKLLECYALSKQQLISTRRHRNVSYFWMVLSANSDRESERSQPTSRERGFNTPPLTNNLTPIHTSVHNAAIFTPHKVKGDFET